MYTLSDFQAVFETRKCIGINQVHLNQLKKDLVHHHPHYFLCFSSGNKALCYSVIMIIMILFIESFLKMCFEGKWLQNRLRADKDESRSPLAVDIQGHQRGCFCIVPIIMIIQMFTEEGLSHSKWFFVKVLYETNSTNLEYHEMQVAKIFLLLKRYEIISYHPKPWLKGIKVSCGTQLLRLSWAPINQGRHCELPFSTSFYSTASPHSSFLSPFLPCNPPIPSSFHFPLFKLIETYLNSSFLCEFVLILLLKPLILQLYHYHHLDNIAFLSWLSWIFSFVVNVISCQRSTTSPNAKIPWLFHGVVRNPTRTETLSTRRHNFHFSLLYDIQLKHFNLLNLLYSTLDPLNFNRSLSLASLKPNHNAE